MDRQSQHHGRADRHRVHAVGHAHGGDAGATGALFVYIGATVSPLANQAAGVYTAAVTLMVLY
jgi:hypothetical protein